MGEEQIINRENEINILNIINKHNIGPKIYYYNDKYRLEEYFNGYIENDCFKYQKILIDEIKKLHSVDIKNANILNFWNRFYLWKNKTNNKHNEYINNVIQKIKNTDSIFNKIVLGHGDLCLGNILLSDNKINLIDFEYSCMLPIGFELANHLCEYSGFTDMDYPKKNVRENLIMYYIDNQKVNSLDLEIIDLYSLISHYYWGCWALLQSNISNIDFNYIEYSEKRFNLFFKYYHKFI